MSGKSNKIKKKDRTIIGNLNNIKQSFNQPFEIITSRVSNAYNSTKQKGKDAYTKAETTGKFKSIQNFFATFIEKYFLLFSIIIIILYIVLVKSIYNENPFDFTMKHPLWSILFSLGGSYLLIMSLVYLKMKFQEHTRPSNYKQLLLISLASILAVMFIIQLYNVSNQIFGAYSDVTSIILILLNLFILIGIISFLIKLIGKDKIKDAIPDRLHILYKLLTFLPCLFISLIENAKKQFNITSKTIWIILFIEILVIILYFLIPFILYKIAINNGILLLENPTYLNHRKTIGVYKNLTTEDIYSYNYSLSFWIYINPQPPNTGGAYSQDTSILNYGGKPNIMYNGRENKFIIKTLKNNKENVVVYETTDLPYQKWNHIVINYNRGTLDTFINTKLVSSSKHIVPYMKYDNLITGEEGGINGGIKNVYYYKGVLNLDQIQNIYNYNKTFSNE